MVRPFTGFMAEDGTTYDTEAECEAYEAAYELHKAVRSQEMVAALDTLAQNYIVTEVVRFISENKPLVARYLQAGSNPQTIELQQDLFDHGRDKLNRLAGTDTGAGGSIPETLGDTEREQD